MRRKSIFRGTYTPPKNQLPPPTRKMDEYNDKTSIRGKIVAKKCGSCGHHGIGIEKEDGTYIQLKPGMKIVGYLHPIPERGEKEGVL